MKKNSIFTLTAISTMFAVSLFFTACQQDDVLSPEGLTSEVHTRSQPPSVPAILEVPAGNEVSFHVYAQGSQIYVVTETSPGVYAWVFKAPDADLFANANYNGNGVGSHFAGPTWKSNSGSNVVGIRLQGATVDPNSIPWLLLGAVSSQGPGVLDGTTFVQRVNTVGGKAPATGANASTVGQEIDVPYTAEYYFYKAA